VRVKSIDILVEMDCILKLLQRSYKHKIQGKRDDDKDKYEGD